MLKQQARLIFKFAVAVDVGTIAAAFVLAYTVIQYVTGNLGELIDYSWVLVVIIPVWLFLLTRVGLYDSMRTKPFFVVLRDLVKVHVLGAVIASASVYLVDPKGYSRLLLGSFILLSLVLEVLAKGSIKLFLKYLRRKGYNSRNLLIVGSGDGLQKFVGIIREHSDWGLSITGTVGLCEKSEEADISGCENLGTVDELVEICKRNRVDEVLFSLPRDYLSVIDDSLITLQEMGIVVRMVVDLYDAPTSRKELSMFHDDIPILTYHSKAFDAGQLFLKRCLDVLGSFVGLVITGFLLPFIAAAIRMESAGPVFFGQERVGENGRSFTCWKFRSMGIDAEEQKNRLLAQNEMNGAMFKIKNDPRVTTVGRWLRATSLDELPQFWNVFMGEMSLVGTRPPTPDEVATYENWHRKRICIKPGITGLWQVSGRSQIQDFDEVVRLDIRYIEEWSLWLDVKILIRTVWVVIVGKGAR